MGERVEERNGKWNRRDFTLLLLRGAPGSFICIIEGHVREGNELTKVSLSLLS